MTKQERPTSYEYCPHDVMRGLRCGPCEDEQARSKPWLESWVPNINRTQPRLVSADAPEPPYSPSKDFDAFAAYVDSRAHLAAAAPALARALLAVEWGGPEMHCAECGQPEGRQHHDACSVDAALIAAGLPTQVERDAARKEIGR